LEGDHGGLSNVRTGGLILSAVAPWAEGKGLYTSMINGGLKWFAAQGVEVSHLGTQVNNYPVQRAWTRLGFRLAKSGPSMHLWLGE
jgi:RimJ/RimL family protein N-acetyltransferase